MSPPAADSEPFEPGEVPFDTGCAGLLVLLAGLCAIIFGAAAFDPEFAKEFGESGRRRITGLIRLGPLDLGALAAMLVGIWEGWKALRRFTARRAVWIEGDMVRFHPTVRRRPLPLAELGPVRHEVDKLSSVLWLELKAGRRIKIPMVDHDAAAAFIAAVEEARAEPTLG